MFKVQPTFSIPRIDGVLDFKKQELWNIHMGRTIQEGSQLLASRINKLLPTNGSEAMTGNLNMGGFGITNLGGVLMAPSNFIGLVVDFAGSVAPTGWLLCFGQSLLRTDYIALFGVIGTTYGAVDGTHFSLPDCRGRVGVGKDDMGGAAANRVTVAGSGITGTSLGNAGGTEGVTLAITDIPNHDHGGSVGAEAAHTHSINGVLATGGALSNLVRTAAGVTPAAFPTGAGSSHTHTITAQGGSGAHRNVQPSIILSKLIYAGV